MYVTYFLYPFSVNRHLDFFQGLAVMNNATKNMRVQISPQIMIMVPFNTNPEEGGRIYDTKWTCTEDAEIKICEHLERKGDHKVFERTTVEVYAKFKIMTFQWSCMNEDLVFRM